VAITCSFQTSRSRDCRIKKVTRYATTCQISGRGARKIFASSAGQSRSDSTDGGSNSRAGPDASTIYCAGIGKAFIESIVNGERDELAGIARHTAFRRMGWSPSSPMAARAHASGADALGERRIWLSTAPHASRREVQVLAVLTRCRGPQLSGNPPSSFTVTNITERS